MMDYELYQKRELHNIYDEIIDGGYHKKPADGTYYERHHILPKSLGGTNDGANLIYLSGNDHFEAHKLLFHIYDKRGPMATAFWLMCNMGNNEYTADEYNEVRIIASARLSDMFDDPDFRQAHIDRLHHRYSNPDIIKACSDRQKLYNSDPEYQKKRLAGLEIVNNDPEFRKRHTDRMTELWSTSIHRQLHLNGMKKIRGSLHNRARVANLHDLETGMIWFNCNLSEMERELGVPRTSFTKAARTRHYYKKRYLAEYVTSKPAPYEPANLHDLETGMIWFNCNLSEMAKRFGFPRTAFANIARKTYEGRGTNIYKKRFMAEYVRDIL